MMTSAEFRIYPIIGRMDFPHVNRFQIAWFNPVAGNLIGFLQYELRPAELRKARRHIEEARVSHFDVLRIPWCAILTGQKSRWKWPGRKSGTKVAVTGVKAPTYAPAPAGAHALPLIEWMESADQAAADATRPPGSPEKG